MNDKNFFPIGFWNYVPCGKIDPEQSAKDWKELGMSLAMSCDYLSPADKEFMLKNLDAAKAEGIKIIVCDCRVNWRNLTAKGEKDYRRDVDKAIKDFGSHPAFYAFHVGDEPDKTTWDDMLKATKIVAEKSRPFVNHFPYYDEDFAERVGVADHNGFTDKLKHMIKSTGADILSYDCYAQCRIHGREEGIENYFMNLNNYYAAAKDCNVPMWTSLLSVGHWNYSVPSEDELRWQISTAVAHGAKGILWFYVYGRFLESSYRQSPFDQYYRRTQTFENLARQNKLFRDYLAPRLANAELIETFHVGKSYGGTKLYSTHAIKGFIINRQYNNPLILSRFKDEDGKEFIFAVNNSQNDIDRITGTYGDKTFDNWLAPGQGVIL